MAEKIISFGVTNKEYKIIETEARKDGMSVSMFCKSKILDTAFYENYQLLLKKVNELPPRSNNIKFSIGDLFDNRQWEKIPKGVRLAIGKQFYNMVKKHIIKNVKIEGFGTSKTMRYSKI
ncbi:MAG: single-stranded DNA-binding protein [Treponema sp.]|jgi:hypothetical protein|nr:single-stranded DNA-binding protein [Treponema sp.]